MRFSPSRDGPKICFFLKEMLRASHVLYGGIRDLVLHCLAAKLLIWTSFAADTSGCFCRGLIVALDLPCSHPLWVRSFHALWVRSLHSGARQSCWDFSLFSTVCRAMCDVLAGKLFACCAWKAASSLSGLLSDLRAQLLRFASTSFLALTAPSTPRGPLTAVLVSPIAVLCLALVSSRSCCTCSFLV